MPLLPEEAGIEVGGLAAFQTRQVEAGLSGRSALAEFREAGGRIADSTWFASYGETRNSLAIRDTLGSVDMTAFPNVDQITPWSGVKEGQYAYSVNVQVQLRFTDPEGVQRTEFVMQPSLLFTDELIPFDQAVAQVLDRYADGMEEGGDTIAGVIMGANLRGVHSGTR